MLHIGYIRLGVSDERDIFWEVGADYGVRSALKYSQGMIHR
jgi:hypothetical protein